MLNARRLSAVRPVAIGAVIMLGVVAVSIATGQGRGGASETPPVFSNVSFEDALKASKESGKVLIVKATAVWCPPCKQMDKTTWRDDKVVEWVKASGQAIALDVDKHAKTAQSLKISAMPTIIYFKGGAEVDRVVGYRGPAEMLTWLENPTGGGRPGAKPQPRADAPAGKDNVDVDTRYTEAQALLRNGDFAKATTEFVWLWDNALTHQPSMVGVRGSFMRNNIAALAKKHAPAKAVFTDKRDAVAARLKDNATWDDLREWIHLNRIIADDDAILAWVDRNNKTEEGVATLRRFGFQFDELLFSRERWADAGLVLSADRTSLDIEAMSRDADRNAPLPASIDREKHLAQMASFGDDRIARTYACVKKAGRDKDAARYAAGALERFDSESLRAKLVTWSKKVDVPAPDMPATPPAPAKK
jgi:thioredoxin 1